MKIIDFVHPRDRREARTALRRFGEAGLPVAGGTALHFLGEGMERAAVDITRLGLSGIRKDGAEYCVGATTVLSDLARFTGPGWVLDRVARRVSTQPVRNVSTLGGNVCRVFFWCDFPVALLALDARFVIAGDEERMLAADEFFASQPSRLFTPGDLLTEVRIPALPPGTGFGHCKQNLVNASFSLMTASARVSVSNGVVQAVRIVAGSGLPFPQRLTAVEDALRGRPAEPASVAAAVTRGAAGLPWKGKEGHSDEYAASLAETTLRDTVKEAIAGAQGGAA